MKYFITVHSREKENIDFDFFEETEEMVGELREAYCFSMIENFIDNHTDALNIAIEHAMGYTGDDFTNEEITDIALDFILDSIEVEIYTIKEDIKLNKVQLEAALTQVGFSAFVEDYCCGGVL